MQEEKQPRHEQTISVVNDQPFITTRLYREDINGTEFITFESTQPYNGTLQQLKEATEEIRAGVEAELQAKIADADTKLAEIDKALKKKK